MSAYDPEMLNIMRNALDQAWEMLPEASKSKSPEDRHGGPQNVRHF